MKEIRSKGREETQAKQESVSDRLPNVHLRHGCVHSAQNDFHDLRWLLLYVFKLNWFKDFQKSSAFILGEQI